MSRRALSNIPFLPSLSFGLLAALLVFLWIAGGASRADVIGQVIVRGVAWTILIAFVLSGPSDGWRAHLRSVGPVAFFVLAAMALAALQLIPLPPSIWTQLPGRELLTQASALTGQEQPWRPLSISPAATVNALSSLIVPFVTLMLAARLSSIEHWRVAALLLGLVAASALIGLLQFSGTRFDHPLINDMRGEVSAFFANRNHFALFAAVGCLLASAWAFGETQRARWKVPVAVALLSLFGLIILATGSRVGILVGGLGIGTGLLIAYREIISELARLPRWGAIALVAGALGLLGAAVALSIVLDRAVSLERALSLNVEQDLRRQALPTVMAMTEMYFPFGTGLGTFDPAYRISEPAELLSLLYFNHAHNDFLEIALNAGLPGLLLLSAALGWWLWMSMRAWGIGVRIKRSKRDASITLLPRVGSAILLLVLIASMTDYPARTPMVMAVVVIAAVWLHRAAPIREESLTKIPS